MTDYSIVEVLAMGSASGAIGAGGLVWFMLRRTLNECVNRKEFDALVDKEKQNVDSIKESIDSMVKSFRRELSLMSKSNAEQHQMIIKMLERGSNVPKSA